MDQLLVRPAQAAKMLAVGRSTLYALVKAGVLPAVRVGRSTRLPVAQLRAWVEAQCDHAHVAQEGESAS
jgi:excisionase family DNA binding protein